MTITQDLAALLTEKQISKIDQQRAALLLLDWTGCAVAGAFELRGAPFQLPISPGTSKCIGGEPSNPQFAAFYNGCLGNVLEMDDVDRQAILHPGPTVIPAALAMAADYSGSDDLSSAVLSAIVIGYETTIRLGRAAGAGHYALWHSTGTCGAFGAAAAASCLIETCIENALSIAGTLSAGLWQTRHEPESDAKQIHTGHAAEIGVKSAYISCFGRRGPHSILEGPQGFFAAMCPGANPKTVLKDYGSQWLIHDTSIKPYPACRHAHPAIDAALKAELCGGPIVIETYDDALKFCDNPNPRSVIEAKFSLQHCVAHTVLSGAPPTLDDFTDEAISKTQRLRRRITVKPSEEFNSAYPGHFGAAVTIGDRRYDAKDAYGDPENPMAETAIVDKAMMLFRHAEIEHSRAQKICQAALDMAHGRDINDYMGLLP